MFYAILESLQNGAYTKFGERLSGLILEGRGDLATKKDVVIRVTTSKRLHAYSICASFVEAKAKKRFVEVTRTPHH